MTGKTSSRWRTARRLWRAAGLAAALCTACQGDNRAPEPPGPPTFPLRELPASGCPLGRAKQRVAAIEGASGWEILSLGRDGSVIYGHRAGGSGREGAARYRAKLLGAAADARPIAVGRGPLLDAALSPARDGLAAVVTADGSLALWRPEGEPLVLDQAIQPGLSFSPGGRRLAYVKGDPPELDVQLVELPEGEGAPHSARRITRHDGPDYLPAMSLGGERVAFVSTRSGLPALWLAGTDGTPPRQLTLRDRDPSSPTDTRAVRSPDGRAAPLWGNSLIVFFDGGGVSAVSQSTGALLARQPGARQPHWLRFGEQIAFELGDGRCVAARLPGEIAAP